MSQSFDKLAPTVGQLERKLSQQVNALYRQELGHQPAKVVCQLSEAKLTIVIESSVTKPEELLVDAGHEDLVKRIRKELEDLIQSPLQDVIQNILGVEVLDILSDSTLETGRAGMIVILKESPQTRSKRSK